MKVLICLALSFFLTACASVGNKIDRTYVDRIEKGVTTEAEIRGQLGNPMSVGVNANGEKIMTYMHVASKARPESFIPIAGLFVGGADSETTMFIITLDSDTGVVKDWNYSQSNTGVNTGLLNAN
ncbi:lipoprotein [Alteromonas sp. KUL150]|jgi:outer membrane protein assembly factor BamE (lipoprotein component of BamABCDE complex)|uniref:hypothetical protein n=1 Tax=Alteromonas sp. KUL150 TaxID=2480805 RepID=UPI0012E452EC|nr:hypothetical protein [Alteromonas sp. KUL150]GFD85066.1 lipoprotein [Alteromonas sp. KUL150]